MVENMEKSNCDFREEQRAHYINPRLWVSAHQRKKNVDIDLFQGENAVPYLCQMGFTGGRSGVTDERGHGRPIID